MSDDQMLSILVTTLQVRGEAKKYCYVVSRSQVVIVILIDCQSTTESYVI